MSFLKCRDSCLHFTLSLSFSLKMLRAAADLAFPWGAHAAVRCNSDEAYEFGANRCAVQAFLIQRQPLVDITLDHRQQVLIFPVDQVKLHSCETPDGFPNMDGNLDRHATVSGFEMTLVPSQLDVIIIEGFMIEVEVVP